MNKIPDIPNGDLMHFVKRIEPYFASDMIIGGLIKVVNLKKVFGITKPARLIQRNYDFYVIKSELDIFQKKIKEILRERGQSYIRNLVRDCFKAGKELIAKSKQIGQKASKRNLTKTDLIKLLEEYYKIAVDYCVYYNVVFLDQPEKEIAEKIVKKYSKTEKEYNEIFSLITSPSQETAAELEQDDFLRICSQMAAKKGDLEKMAEVHVKKYDWLSLRYFLGNPWTKKDIIKRVRSVDKKKAAAMLNERLNHRQATNNKLINFLKNISKEDRLLVPQIRDVVFLRTQRADYYQHSSLYIQPLVKRIAQMLKLKYKDLLYFSVPEIVSGKIDFHKHVKVRKKDYIIFHGHNLVLEGKKVVQYIKTHPVLKRSVDKATQLSGNAAFKGVVTGRVKIVINNEDVPKVKKGDIIVSIMTTPNFIAAMEKAAAFVTDEGGILCHAAIVSREMRKPCIIATKTATLVLKDNDLVEVDAIKGIVKKL